MQKWEYTTQFDNLNDLESLNEEKNNLGEAGYHITQIDKRQDGGYIIHAERPIYENPKE